MKPRAEYIIAVAMLRGCELTSHNGCYVASGDGYYTESTGWWDGPATAAEGWLKHFGIHFDADGRISDLGTKVEA